METKLMTSVDCTGEYDCGRGCNCYQDVDEADELLESEYNESSTNPEPSVSKSQNSNSNSNNEKDYQSACHIFEGKSPIIKKILPEAQKERTEGGGGGGEGEVSTKIITKQQRTIPLLPIKQTPWTFRRYKGYIPTMSQRRLVPGGLERAARRRRDMRTFILKREFFKKYLRYKALKIKYEKYLIRERRRKRRLFLRRCLRLIMFIFALHIMYGICLEIMDFTSGLIDVFCKIINTPYRIIRCNAHTFMDPSS